MSMNIADAVFRYRETYKVLRVVVLISILGMIIEFVFAYISSSIIIYTDVLHWSTDTALEVISMITFYIVSKVYKRIKWNVFALESLLVLTLVLAIFGFYIVLLIDTINSYTRTSFEPTTTDPYLAFVTAIGGFLTFLTYVIERRAYQRLKTDILRVDTTHAMIDIAVAVIASLGIIVTALTRNYIIELVIVLLVLLVALQTLMDLAKEAIKSILGFEADPRLKAALITRLSELNRDNVRVGDVELRKIGTFYVAKIKIFLDPKTTIDEAHKLRKTINILCREVSELIYHVDVLFYPKKKLEKYKRKERYGRQR